MKKCFDLTHFIIKRLEYISCLFTLILFLVFYFDGPVPFDSFYDTKFSKLKDLPKIVDNFRFSILEYKWEKVWKKISTEIKADALLKVFANDAPILNMEKLNQHTKTFYWNNNGKSIEINSTNKKRMKMKVFVELQKDSDFEYFWLQVKDAISHFEYFELDFVEEGYDRVDFIKNLNSTEFHLFFFINENVWVNFNEVFAIFQSDIVHEPSQSLVLCNVAHDEQRINLEPGFFLTASFIEKIQTLWHAGSVNKPSNKNHSWLDFINEALRYKILGVQSLEGLNPSEPLDSIKELFHDFYLSRNVSANFGIVPNIHLGHKIVHRHRAPITFGAVHKESDMFELYERFDVSFMKHFNRELELSTSIPPIIHQIWIGNLDSKTKRLMKHCELLHKTTSKLSWKYKLWTLEDLKEELGPEITNFILYKGYEHQSLLKYVDIARLFVLYKYGGIYIDSDTLCIKPLDPVLDVNSQNYLPLERFKPETPSFREGFSAWESVYHTSSLMANGMMGFIPKSKLLYFLIHHIFYRLVIFTKTIEEGYQAWKATGPLPFSFMYRYLNSWTDDKSSLLVFPFDMFYPIHYSYDINIAQQWYYANWKNSYTCQLWSSTKNATAFDMIWVHQNLEDLLNNNEV